MSDRHAANEGTVYVLVYATFPGDEEADRIAAELVRMRLAACVNLVPGMRSLYRWQGAVEQGQETIGIIKTRRRLAERVMGVVRVLHPYTVPALVMVPITGGSPAFLDWIGEETLAGEEPDA